MYSRYKPLIRYMVYKYVLPFLALFTFLMVSLEAQKFLILMKSSVSVFSPVTHTFGVITCCVFLIKHFSP